MSRKKRMMYFFAVLAVLFTLTVVVAYINDAPFRWSRNLCEAIRMDDTDASACLCRTLDSAFKSVSYRLTGRWERRV